MINDYNQVFLPKMRSFDSDRARERGRKEQKFALICSDIIQSLCPHSIYVYLYLDFWNCNFTFGSSLLLLCGTKKKVKFFLAWPNRCVVSLCPYSYSMNEISFVCAFHRSTFTFLWISRWDLLCLDSCSLLVFASTCSDTRNPVPFWLFSDCFFYTFSFPLFILIIVLYLYVYLYFNVLYCIVIVFASSSSDTWNPGLVPFLLFIVISLCLSSRVIQKGFHWQSRFKKKQDQLYKYFVSHRQSIGTLFGTFC